jgi:drug/metabolite transporter (DMT)-like permease
LKLLAAFGAVYFIWGSTYLFIHFALAQFPPFLLAGLRFLAAGVVLYLWARMYARIPRPTGREWRAGFVTGGMFFLLGNGAVVWSQQRVHSGIAALLVAVVPLWIVLFDWARPPHNRPRPIVLTGVAVGLIGLVLLVGLDTLRGTGEIDLLAALVLGAGSLSWAYGTLYSQRAPLPKSSAMMTAVQLLGGGLLLMATSVLAGEPSHVDWASISPGAIGSMLYLITFGSLVGFSAYAWLLPRSSRPTRT